MKLQIDPSKLTNVVPKPGKIVARCPACVARGGDTRGNNLVVYGDGRFGCVAAPKNRDHNRLILKLAGIRKPQGATFHVPLRRIYHPPSQTVEIVGRVGRPFSTPAKELDHVDP
jgi:hypothetical protein